MSKPLDKYLATDEKVDKLRLHRRSCSNTLRTSTSGEMEDDLDLSAVERIPKRRRVSRDQEESQPRSQSIPAPELEIQLILGEGLLCGWTNLLSEEG